MYLEEVLTYLPCCDCFIKYIYNEDDESKKAGGMWGIEEGWLQAGPEVPKSDVIQVQTAPVSQKEEGKLQNIKLQQKKKKKALQDK